MVKIDFTGGFENYLRGCSAREKNVGDSKRVGKYDVAHIDGGDELTCLGEVRVGGEGDFFDGHRKQRPAARGDPNTDRVTRNKFKKMLVGQAVPVIPGGGRVSGMKKKAAGWFKPLVGCPWPQKKDQRALIQSWRLKGVGWLATSQRMCTPPPQPQPGQPCAGCTVQLEYSGLSLTFFKQNEAATAGCQRHSLPVLPHDLVGPLDGNLMGTKIAMTQDRH